MTPDIRAVRRKLETLRAMIEVDMPVKTRWLALRLIDSAGTALGPELPPTPEAIEDAYVERHTCLVIPFPRGPSGMTRDLLLEET